MLGYEAAQKAPSTLHGIGCWGPNFWISLVPSFAMAILYLAWSVVLIYFFGRDFIHASRRIVP